MSEENTVNPAEELKKAAEEAANTTEKDAKEASSASEEASQNEKKEDEKATEAEPEVTDKAPTDAEDAMADLATELRAAKDEAAKHYELYIRAAAEMENTRRRCAQDVMKARLFGIESFAKNLLPVIDSLEKALASATNADEATRKGLEVTMKQLDHALEVSGMKAINPEGAAFDPNQAQAIAMVPADAAHAAGTVVTVFQRGWMLNERVLRAAMVSVAQ